MRRVPWREIRDRRVLGGWSYLGSAAWAAFHLGAGYLLWILGAYFPRADVDPRLLLATMTVASAALLFRRSAPGLAVGLGVATTLVESAFLGPSVLVFIILGDTIYSASAWGRRRLTWSVLAVIVTAGLAAAAVGGYFALIGAFPGGPLNLLQLLGLYTLVFATPALTGMTVREHLLRADLERQRVRQVERMAELDRANAVAEERGRMARELHDVIANHLSAVAVQSTAALSMREFDPERVRHILAVVRDNSVQGLAEMRRMIRVLRDDGQADPSREPPRLSEVDRLVDHAREAGLTVSLVHRGESGGLRLPGQVDAAAYRIVQESLTNALRYADPRRIDITIEHPHGHGEARNASPALVITAENATSRHAPPAWPHEYGAGAGLTGMRERVTLLGGRFSAGPVDGDRWRVRAELPLGSDPAGPEREAPPRYGETELST